MELVIGADPGLTATALSLFIDGVLKETLLIKPKTSDRKMEIILQLNKFFGEVFSKYAGLKIILAIETQYIFLKNNAVLKTSEVKGMIEATFRSWFVSGCIIEISPSEAKKAMGMIHRLKRKESKKFILDVIQKIYPSITSQDVADSISIGICAIKKLTKLKT